MKVGIVGAGTIVPDFLNAQKLINDIEVVAISGIEADRVTMEKLSSEYSISYIYVDYKEMLKNEEVDTVYVAVPNMLHYPFTKMALENNKNVILEKPFVVKKNEAEEIYNIAKKNKLYVFEAIPNIYYPNYWKVKELVKKLGDIKLIQINYSQYSRRYDQFKEGMILPVFDPKKAGGAIMDLNVYNVHFVTGLFGMPKNVQYFANIEKGIDTSGILAMEYENMQCVCVAAKDCKAPLTINVQGDKGYIHSDSPANVFAHFEYGQNIGDKEYYELNEYGWNERMFYELSEFNKLLVNDDFDLMLERLQHSIEVVGLLEKARETAGISFD